MPVTWLHISDLHVQSGDSYDRDVVFRALVKSVRRFRERDGRTPDLILQRGTLHIPVAPPSTQSRVNFSTRSSKLVGSVATGFTPSLGITTWIGALGSNSREN